MALYKLERSLVFALLAGCIFALAAAAEPSAASGKKPSEPAQENLAPVLPPEQFFGAAAMGYAAAKAIPHTCHKLFCYCGCDITDSHSNLLDCFTSIHGADCHICQEEALQALRMTRDGSELSAIQKNIDETYSSKYPFKEDSPAYKKYKASRLWTAGGSILPAAKPSPSSAEACCNGKGQKPAAKTQPAGGKSKPAKGKKAALRRHDCCEGD